MTGSSGRHRDRRYGARGAALIALPRHRREGKPMSTHDHVDLDGFIDGVKRRNPGQSEFIQAVTEVAQDVFPFIEGKEDYHRWQILRRIAEPDRVVSFRVVWQDDNNHIR